jgi:hypothetical protein
MEWARKKVWEAMEFTVMRTAGSHGAFDLIAVHYQCPVYLIQCKRAQSEAQATRMLEKWMLNPPLPKSRTYIQVMEVLVPRKGVFSAAASWGPDDE